VARIVCLVDRTLHTSMVLVWLVDPMCGVHQSVEVRYIIRLNIYVVLYIVSMVVSMVVCNIVHTIIR
jgi:hypothetical protein